MREAGIRGRLRALDDETAAGLAFALELAHRMNGSLTASSELGRGSLFRLSLPRATHTRE
jgi:signal transduction histidine kinase